MVEFLSIDPSFTRSGIYYKYPAPIIPSKLDKGNNFLSLSESITEASFPYLVGTVERLATQIELVMASLKPETFVMEYASPVGQWAAGLYMLDLEILRRAQSFNCIKSIYLVPPNAINSRIGKRSVSKTEIVNYAKDKLSLSSRINHDEASAFVLWDIVESRIRNLKKKPTIFMLYEGEINRI